MPLDFGPLPRAAVTRVALDGAFAGREEVEIEWGGAVIPFDRAPAAVGQAMRAVDEALPMLRPAQRRAVRGVVQAILTRADAFHDAAHGTAFDRISVSAVVAVEDGLLDKAGDAPRLVHVNGSGICRSKDAGSFWHGEHAAFHVGRRGGLTATRTRKAKRGDGFITDRFTGGRAWIHGFALNGLD
jgi:hypothetical protein